MNRLAALVAAALMMAGCDPDKSPRVDAFDASAWKAGEWISVPGAPVAGEAQFKSQRAADGTSWFVAECVNDGEVSSAKWMLSGLGVFEAFLNGERVGNDALKPGFTHYAKTKYAFTYDVTKLMKTGAGECNVLAAEVSSGWWRDQIIKFRGTNSAFRAVLSVEYKDGSRKLFGTNCRDWKCGIGGPVTHAGIFDGEEYDARVKPPRFGSADFVAPVVNTEFKGEVLPTAGAEICYRSDIVLSPVEAYCWKGVEGQTSDAYGKVIKTRVYSPDDTMKIAKGETLVVDFGQNAAAVPFFRFRAAPGTVLTALPAEMLNDGNGAKCRGNDGPEGAVYRLNLRIPQFGMRNVYTFGGDGTEWSEYMPRFTFFGYRYISISATEDVEIAILKSVPVTSITREMELGKIETGDASINRLIANVYWGQLSNYLSVPTDCPQRNERLGWAADTQVFCSAAAYNANVYSFLSKWMRDERDTVAEDGSFTGVSPVAQYGMTPHEVGWADAGVIVPYRMWCMFGDVEIVRENWDAMKRFVDAVSVVRYTNTEACRKHQWADWLSYEAYETCSGKANGRDLDKAGQEKARRESRLYWKYLGGCYWLWDALMMSEMAAAVGQDKDIVYYREMAEKAREYVRFEFIGADGMLIPLLRGMQTPALFALKFGLLKGDAAIRQTCAELRKNIADHDGCLQTGFLGTSILMDTLTENGMVDVAYGLLFQRKNPSWLYSVDQGATTIWERWNSYRKDTGFGPVGMNSFNHYAYGAVLDWIYGTVAGIAEDPKAPGFRNIVMKPVPCRRLGFVNAEYRSANGLVKSAWKFDGDNWIWDFTVPEGATASVTLPGDTVVKTYSAGSHHIEMRLP